MEAAKKIWDKILEQSLLFVLLIVSVYVLWNKVENVDERFDEYVQKDHAEMLSVIKDNTEAIQEFRFCVRENIKTTLK
jgi:hypothetical protein